MYTQKAIHNDVGRTWSGNGLKSIEKKKMNLEKQRKINLRKDVNDYQSKRNNKKTNLFRNQVPKVN